MELEDLTSEARLLAHEIAHSLRRLDAAAHAAPQKRVAAVLEAIDTRARVRRILSWAQLDPFHEADILARLRHLSERIRVVSASSPREP